MAYIELADLRSYIGIDALGDDPLLQEAIKAAQTYIESQTNRVFEAATLTKYYERDALDDEDSTLLHLGTDCVTVTTLLNGDSSATEILVANYWLLNRNLGPPYHWIKLKSNVGVYWQWDTDYWVSVTGTWGYSATPPEDIKAACTHLAAFYYRQKDSQVFDVTAIPDAGVITIPQGIPATVTRIINRYKRYL